MEPPNGKRSAAMWYAIDIRRVARTTSHVVLVLMIVALAGSMGVKWTAREIILRQLDALGYADSSIGRLRIGLFGADCEDLRISSGRGRGVRVERLSLHYRPTAVLEGRLDSMRVDGVSARLEKTDSAWKFSGLPLPELPESEAPADGKEPSGRGFDAPVSHIVVADVRIALAGPGHLGGRSVAIDALSCATQDGTVVCDWHGSVFENRMSGRLSFDSHNRMLNAWVHAPNVRMNVEDWFPRTATGVAGTLTTAVSTRAEVALPSATDRMAAAWSLSVQCTNVQSDIRTGNQRIFGTIEGMEIRGRGKGADPNSLGVQSVLTNAHIRGTIPRVHVESARGNLPSLGAVENTQNASAQADSGRSRGSRQPASGTVVLTGLSIGGWHMDPLDLSVRREPRMWTLRLASLGFPDLLGGIRLQSIRLEVPKSLSGTWQATSEVTVAPASLDTLLPLPAGWTWDDKLSTGIRVSADVGQSKRSGSLRLRRVEAEALAGQWSVDMPQGKVGGTFDGSVAGTLRDGEVAASARARVGLDSEASLGPVRLAGKPNLAIEMQTVSAPVKDWKRWLDHPDTPPKSLWPTVVASASIPSIESPTPEVVAENATLSLPLQWQGGAELHSPRNRNGEGSVDVCRVAGHPVTLSPVSIRFAGTRAELKAEAELGDADSGVPILSAEGTANCRWGIERSCNASMRLQTSNPKGIADFAGKVLGRGSPLPVSLNGNANLRTEMHWQQHRPPSTAATFELDNVRVESEDPQLVVAGLNGTVEVRDLSAGVHTLPHQKISFDSALVGTVPVDGGTVVFQLENPDSIFMERCHLKWCGGTVTSHAVTVHPSRKDLALTLYVDAVSLSELFSLQTLVDGSAEGVLYGKLPFRYQDGEASFERGYLYSPPGTTGRLQLEQADVLFAGLPKDSSRIEIAKKTLRDMEYDYLRFDINTENRTTPLEITILGHARNDPSMRAVKLNATIESNLNDLLDVQKGMKRLNLSP